MLLFQIPHYAFIIPKKPIIFQVIYKNKNATLSKKEPNFLERMLCN